MSAYAEKIKKLSRRGYFRTADFETEREITLTIESLEQDQIIFESDQPKDLLYFQEDGRFLQLNVTHAQTLIALFGDEPSAWPGKKITLYLTSYETRRGEQKPCIRIKAPGTAGNSGGNGATMKDAVLATSPSAPAAKRDDMDDEIPF